MKLDELREGLHKQVNPSPTQERYLTNAEVCDLLKVSRRTLQRYRDEGRIAFSQVGATIRYKAADVERFLHDNYNPSFLKTDGRL